MKRISVEEAEKRGYEVVRFRYYTLALKDNVLRPCYTPLEWELLGALKLYRDMLDMLVTGTTEQGNYKINKVVMVALCTDKGGIATKAIAKAKEDV